MRLLSWISNQRIIELFKLEGTLKYNLFQLPCSEQSHLYLIQVAQSSAQSDPEYPQGPSTTSLGNLFLCFIALIVKNFFLIFSLTLPSFSVEPFSPVLANESVPCLIAEWRIVFCFLHSVFLFACFSRKNEEKKYWELTVTFSRFCFT